MARSNMFANMENEFQFFSKDEIVEAGRLYRNMLVQELSGIYDDSGQIFAILIFAAAIGIGGDGKINKDEKYAIKEILGEAWTGPINALYDAVSATINDDTYNYDTLEKIVQLGNNIAIFLLKLILSFAYIDGSFEDDVARRLDPIFGMSLLMAFMQSGMESVPAPKVKISVTKIEKEIIDWMKVKDDVYTLDTIQSAFSSYSKSELVGALDSLGEKDILIGKGKLMDGLYCLNGCLGNVIFELSDKASKKVKSTSSTFDKKNNTGKKQQNKDSEESKQKKLQEEAARYGVSVSDLSNHKIYLAAKELMNTAVTTDDYNRAAEEFNKITFYQDAFKLKNECERKSQEIEQLSQIIPVYDDTANLLTNAKDDFEKEIAKGM